MSWLISNALMNSLSLQGLVVESLEDTSLDGEQSVPLSGNPIPQAYLSPDKMTDFSRLSQYGMTFKPLTETRGEELLTLYLEDFLAKTSAPQEREPELTESDPECGVTWRESLARYDRATSSWKTPQCSLLEDSTVFSGTWPRWGLMRDGVSYRQQPLVRHIKETGFGSWPTPTAAEGSKIPATANYGQVGLNNHPRIRGEVTRSKQTKSGKFPTPTAHNSKEGGYPAEFTRNTPSLNAVALGGTQTPQMPLNPTWVEWLMGWPLGWTDLKPLEMDKYRSWQQQHGGS